MNKELVAALKRDDDAEDAGMHPDDRTTCWTHQCWASDCENDPMHTSPGPFWAADYASLRVRSEGERPA